MQNLIIWEPFDYIQLFILGFLPLIYKLSFWLYTIQLKEYRWDRFREYLWTKQWKSALFNIFFIVDFVLIIWSIFIYLYYLFWDDYYVAFWWITYHMFFYYLLILNIFVIWKIFRKNILRPKITSRLIILVLLIIFWLSIDFYFFIKLNLFDFTYFYILGIFSTIPFMIFIFNFISLPLVNYKKNKQINRAIKKSEKNNDIIKIWITWSYWKSSVKEFLSSILEQEDKTLKTPENQNTEMSVSALVLNKLNKKYKYFVAEMWAYRIWEISILWKIVNHKYWFLTAIWNHHIWLFGSQENIAKAKFEIAESVLKNDWILYVNWDCEEIKKYLNKTPTLYQGLNNKVPDKGFRVIKYWIKSENKLEAVSNIISVEKWKTKFEFNYKDIKTEFEINLIWEHNIVNLTWVVACCIDLGLKIDDIKKYLKKLKTPDNTKNIIELWDNILIDDTYNLSEAGLKSWLNLLKNYNSDYNKILVLDDILELWKQAEKIHFNIWKKIAEEKLVDKVLFCWANYKDSFVNWLIELWFNEENILVNLDEISENSIILFEWRNAKKYLNKINK